MVSDKVSIIDVKGELTAFAEGVLMQAYTQGWHIAIRECPGWWGGSPKVSGRFSNLHIPAKNPLPVSWIQAYIAYLFRGCVPTGRSSSLENLVLQRHLLDLHVSLLLPPLRVLPSHFARNRLSIVYFDRLEIQREEARA